MPREATKGMSREKGGNEGLRTEMPRAVTELVDMATMSNIGDNLNAQAIFIPHFSFFHFIFHFLSISH